MEKVASFLWHQDLRFDGRGSPADGLREEDIPWGARVLKLVLDLDALESRGMTTPAALEVLRGREGWYDPEVLRVFGELSEAAAQEHQEVVEIEVRDIRAGMVLAEDLRTNTGLLLVARGQPVSERAEERLRYADGLIPPRQRVHVTMPSEGKWPEERNLNRQPRTNDSRI